MPFWAFFVLKSTFYSALLVCLTILLSSFGSVFYVNRGIKAGKIFGIDLFIDYSWIVIFVIVSFILATRYFPSQYPDLSLSINIILGIVSAVLFFASAFVHELTHSIVARINKIKVKRITLFLFGGMSELFEEPPNAEVEFKIALAGPATSIVLAIIFLITWRMLDRYTMFLPGIAVASTLFQVNMILAVFNLLPGYPLDGGRIIRSLMWALSKDINSATRIATSLGQLVAFFIIVFGILQIIVLGMWSGIWLILIGLFLIQTAGQSYLELQIRETLSEQKVEDLMNPNILTLHPNLSINDALAEYFIKYASQSFPVVKDNDVVGLISLRDIRAQIETMSDDARVSEVMRSFPKNLFLQPRAKALDALRIMMEKDLSFLPVKTDKRIVGMITLESIANFLAEERVI